MRDMSRKSVFIGNFRSGTTLLVNILGLHEHLAPWYETKGFCEVLRWLRVIDNPQAFDFESRLAQPNWIPGFSADAVAARLREDFRATAARISGEIGSGKASHERYPVGHDCVLYALDEAENAVADWYERITSPMGAANMGLAAGELIMSLGNLHAQKAGKPMWVNKTPELPRFGSELRKTVGPCRIILMIRDGRDVVQSASRLGWANPEEIADWWKGMILESRQAAQSAPDDYLEIKYEELLEHPVDVLNRVLRFIGVEEKAGELVDRYIYLLNSLGVEARFGERTASIKKIRDKKLTELVDAELLEALGYL